jgi:hypothetical protein
MKDLLRKYHKVFVVFAAVICIMISYSLYSAIRYSLPQTVRVILMKTLGTDIEMGSLKFEKFGYIEAKDVTLKDGEELIFSAPKVEINYTFGKIIRGHIDSINVENPTLWISRDENNDINIVEAFSKDSSGSSERKKSSSKAGSGVPIDIITVKGGELFYIDTAYDRPIEKKVENVKGYVSFDKKKGINLDFDGDINGEKYRFLFDNNDKRYSIRIKLEDVKINDDLMQYAYDSENLTYLSGNINLDLTIEPGSLNGSADFSEAKVTYNGLNGIPENISGNVSFNGDKIYVSSEFDFHDEKGEFLLSLVRGEGLDLDFYFEDLDYSFLKNYDTLNNINLPLEGTDFDSVHINLNFDKDYDFALKINFESPLYTYGNLKAKDIRGIFKYKNEHFSFEDVKFTGYFDNSILPLKGMVELDSVLDKNGGELNYKILGIESKTNLKKANGSLNFDFDKKKIDFEMNSDFLSFYGDVDMEKKLLSIKQDSENDLEVMIRDKNYKNKSTLDIIYDYGEKSFLLGRGKVNIKSQGHNLTGDVFAIKDNFKINSIVYDNGGTELTGEGNLNVKTLEYDFNFATVNMDLNTFFNIQELKLNGDYRGKIKGKGHEFQGDIRVENVNGKYFSEFNNLEGDIYVKYDGKFKMYFKGYLDELSYMNNSFYDFQFNGELEDNLLKIKDFGNNILTVHGNYNIAEKNLDFEYGITELSNKRLNFHQINFNADKINGSIKGHLSNISAEALLEGILVEFENGKTLDISGNLKFNDKILKFQNFKINENLLKGIYKIDDKSYSFKLNLFEENLPGYYDDINIKYRVMGEVYIWGYGENLRSFGMISADRVYFRGEKMPNVFFEGSFLGGVGKEFGKQGKIDLNKLTLLNDHNENILEAKASLDLKTRYLHLQNTKNQVDISKLSYLFPGMEEEGILNLNMELAGPLEDLSYKLKLKGDTIKISDIKLDDIDVEVTGDFEKINLGNFSINYLGNNLNAGGTLAFKPFNYDFNISSSEIDLKLLNLFLSPFGVENIDGKSKIDIHLNKSKNSGRFYVENLKGEIPKYNIVIQDVNSDIRLDNDLVFIEEFKGKVNDGDLSLTGYLKIPDIDKLNDEVDLKTSLDYSLSLKMYKVRYDYQNVIKLILSSNATFEKNKITGNFTVDRGEITGIPKVSNTDIEELKKKISVNQNEVVFTSKELGSDFAIEGVGSKDLEMDINLDIKEGIFINLKEVATLVKNLEAVIKGDGKLSLKDKKLKFLGQLETQKGEVIINDNLFIIDRAVVIFDKKDEYFPDVNPILLVSARSIISDEEVSIGISGEYDDMDIVMSSSSGLNQEDIAALLAFHQTLDSSENSNAMFKNVVDSQLSTQLFNPVSNEVQRFLRISKFKISSDIVAYDESDDNYQDNSSLGFGASIEAGNAIYKDKFFWNAKARIADTQYGDSIDEYDFTLEHKFTKKLSWGFGVEKLPEGTLNIDEEDQSNLNYHIDFKFRQTYDSIFDIFRKK